MFSPSPELTRITHLYRTSDWTDGQRDRPPKAFTEDRASGMGGGGGRVGDTEIIGSKLQSNLPKVEHCMLGLIQKQVNYEQYLYD